MKRSRIWMLVLVSAACSGILLGVLLFFMFNQSGSSMNRHDSNDSGTDTPPFTGSFADDPDPAAEPTEEQESEIETETEVKEDFSDYFGTYTAGYGKTILVDMSGDGDTMNKPRQIGAKALLYIDQFQRDQNGNLLGQLSYFGLTRWVPVSDLEKISDYDYSISAGDRVILCENWSEIRLMQEPDPGSSVYSVDLHLGDELEVLELRNGYFRTTTRSGVTGWISGDCVAKFDTGYPCQMMYTETNSSDEIPFYLDYPGAADVVIGEEDGHFGEGSVLWFEEFSGGWGYTIINGEGVWVSMVNAVPVPETRQQNVLNYWKYEPPLPSGRTDFYKDGTPVDVDEFILPAAQTRYLTDGDMNALTLKGISYAKNELYAKYGRKFKAEELTQYMATKTWYTPKYEPEAKDAQIVSQMMNAYERYNIDILRQREDALGPYEYD